jgi:hypothetical protein
MSVLTDLSGAPLSAEGELVRIFLGLEAAHRSAKLQLTGDAVPVTEPVFSWSVANYPNQPTNKQRLVIVGYLPLPDNYTELAGKLWANIAEVGTASIPSSFGSR